MTGQQIADALTPREAEAVVERFCKAMHRCEMEKRSGEVTAAYLVEIWFDLKAWVEPRISKKEAAMNKVKDDGGSAFPLYKPDGMDQTGISARDYFAAHAPPEPQSWFKPALPPIPLSHIPVGLTDEQTELYNSLRNNRVDRVDDPIVQDHYDKYLEACAARSAWHEESHKQRLLQWPWAWADEMIARRMK